MLVLLPPSETKRPGGDGPSLDLDGLALPSLREPREQVVAGLVELSADEEASARVLKLSARRLHEVADNAALRSAPTLPAVDRYTGVLFDALDAETLDEPARAWLGAHVLIHSAPFGPVGALDGIPPYRLAASTSLPGLPSLRKIWADAVTAAIRDARPEFVLDLRSEAYAALGPVPADVASVYVRVVSEGGDGVTRALNHFNKKAKGMFTRSLATAGARVRSLDDLLGWAASTGHSVRVASPGEIELIV
ncbi:YaaA family protein [Microbacterium sp. SLBN-111]|uniref:YaaA family protein n=1 Tax=Microbacterium sp. SLBN-111 TaxID=3377733 RepID=UPI003C791452